MFRPSDHPRRNILIVFLYYVNSLFNFTVCLPLIYTVKYFYVFPVICYIKHVLVMGPCHGIKERFSFNSLERLSITFTADGNQQRLPLIFYSFLVILQ